MKKYFLLFLASCFFLISAAQTVVTIPASADNTIYQNPSGNSNALGENIFSGTNGNNSPRRGLIKFDIAAAIPAGATITSVTLTMNCNISRSIPDNVSLHLLSANWGEATSDAGASGDGGGATATPGDATWISNFFGISNWAVAGGDFNATASSSASVSTEGDVTWSTAAMAADVQSWLTLPAGNFGWILLCNETTASTARRFGSRENATVANRPSLSITYSTVVPVTLTHFKASVINAGIQLDWETTQEINNAYFTVMHSKNGILFDSVGKLLSKGSGTQVNTYRFIHGINIPGNHFYKLVQVDHGGRATQSSIIRIEIAPGISGLKLWPNPVQEIVYISGAGDFSNASYRIFNMQGALMLTGKLNGAGINVTRLSSGKYYVCVYPNKKPEIINFSKL